MWLRGKGWVYRSRMCRCVVCRGSEVRSEGDVRVFVCYFFFNDTATTEIYTLSLHDALPICSDNRVQELSKITRSLKGLARELNVPIISLSQLSRSEEHTSELQSPVPISYAVFCLKKKKKIHTFPWFCHKLHNSILILTPTLTITSI